MRAVVGGEIGVKAAGGVRSLEDFKKMVQAGATRIGASASVKILEQARAASPTEAIAIWLRAEIIDLRCDVQSREASFPLL